MPDRVSANTEDLCSFVDHGGSYRVDLMKEALKVRQARLQAYAALGLNNGSPRPEVLLRSLVGDVEQNNIFVANIAEALENNGVTESGITSAPSVVIDTALRRQRLSADEAEFGWSKEDAATELAARDDVIKAMQTGQTPEQAGLLPEFFPFLYLETLEKQKAVDDLVERKKAQLFVPRDQQTVGAINDQLDRERQARDDAARETGADEQGRLNEVEAILLLGDWTGDRAWEGKQYGAWVDSYYDKALDTTTDGHPKLSAPGNKDASDDFRRIGKELSVEPETALGFYNELEAKRSAFLPTVLVDNIEARDDDALLAETMADYGVGLGLASQQTDNSEPTLTFTGQDLMQVDLPTRTTSAFSGDESYHQAFLFGTGTFSTEFLADATVELLNKAETDPRATRAIQSNFVFAGDQPAGSNIETDGRGQDPRNIMLSRSNEDIENTAAVVAKLASQEWNQDLLLSPAEPYRESFKSNGAFTVPTEHTIPITNFLISAGQDDRTSQILLRAVAANTKQAFSDVHVAAGVDGILAQHITLMYPDHDLQAVGLKQSGINDLPSKSREEHITAEQWKTVHAKVLDFGQGGLMAHQTEVLLNHAITETITKGDHRSNDADSFATIAGAVGSETTNGIISYNAGLDEQVRAHNRRVNTAAAGTFAAIGLLPGAGFPAAVAGTTTTWFDFLSIPTDNELEALRNEYDKLNYTNKTGQWSDRIYKQKLAMAVETGSIELIVPFTREPQTVEIRTGDDNKYQWREPPQTHLLKPATELVEQPKPGPWQDLPQRYENEYVELFSGTPTEDAVGLATTLRDRHQDGTLFAADDKLEVIRSLTGVDPRSQRLEGEGDEDYAQRDKIVKRQWPRLNTAENVGDRLRIREWVANG